MKKTPHRSGEHGRPQRPRTHSCGNTGLPGGFPAPHGRGGMRLRSPAARGPGGETRRHPVRDETGAIREPHRPHRLDHPDHPGRVPLHHRQPGGLRRADRRRPGGGAAPLRGDRRRRQGAGNRNRRGPGRGQIRRHRALGVSRNTVYRSWGRAGNREQRPRSRPGKVGLRAKAWTRTRTSRPTSPRPVWPMRRAMTSQTNPHG